VYAFRDHLTFLDRVMPEAHIQMGCASKPRRSPRCRSRSPIEAGRQALRRGRARRQDGGLSEGICHNIVIEDIALPGQLVAGTDSHTCMAGALGCFAFGVGSTDMANAWFTKDVRVAVPESVRFNLRGTLRPGVTAKDVMLHLLSQPFWQDGRGHRQGARVRGPRRHPRLSLDERATLTNMAVEAGGFTGIIEADEVVVDYLVKQRGTRRRRCARAVKRRRGRELLRHVRHRSRTIEPMVARPATRATASRSPSSRKQGQATWRSTSPTAARAPAARRPTWTCTPRCCAARSITQGAPTACKTLHPVRLAGHPPTTPSRWATSSCSRARAPS
jgi:3-isopropylmalate/(R)-2-methylmalate dehydratase large subunit